MGICVRTRAPASSCAEVGARCPAVILGTGFLNSMYTHFNPSFRQLNTEQAAETDVELESCGAIADTGDESSRKLTAHNSDALRTPAIDSKQHTERDKSRVSKTGEAERDVLPMAASSPLSGKVRSLIGSPRVPYLNLSPPTGIASLAHCWPRWRVPVARHSGPEGRWRQRPKGMTIRLGVPSQRPPKLTPIRRRDPKDIQKPPSNRLEPQLNDRIDQCKRFESPLTASSNKSMYSKVCMSN